MAQDPQNPSLWQRFSNQVDPMTMGMHLLASNTGRQPVAANLGAALLQGRQTRLQQNQAAAEANLAKRREAIDIAKAGVQETAPGQFSKIPEPVSTQFKMVPVGEGLEQAHIFNPKDQTLTPVPGSKPVQAKSGVTVNVGKPEFPFDIEKGHMAVDLRTGEPLTPESFDQKLQQGQITLADVGQLPIKGGSVERRSQEGAAKEALIQGTLTNLNAYEKLLFDEEGNVNRGRLAASNTPLGGVPGTEGRTMNALFLDALEGKIRIESGAAVPEAEVQRGAARFRPSVFDRDDTIRTKLAMLRRFAESTLVKARPEDYMVVDGERVVTPEYMQRVYSEFDKQNSDLLQKLEKSQKQDRMTAWEKLPEGSVIQQGGKSYRKVNGQAVEVQ